MLEGIPGTTQAAEVSHTGVCTEPRGRRSLLSAALAPSARAHSRAHAVDQVLAGRAAQLALDQVHLVGLALGEDKQRLGLQVHVHGMCMWHVHAHVHVHVHVTCAWHVHVHVHVHVHCT